MPWPSAKNVVKSNNLHYKGAQSFPVGGSARTVGTNNPTPTTSPGRKKRTVTHTERSA